MDMIGVWFASSAETDENHQIQNPRGMQNVKSYFHVRERMHILVNVQIQIKLHYKQNLETSIDWRHTVPNLMVKNIHPYLLSMPNMKNKSDNISIHYIHLWMITLKILCTVCSSKALDLDPGLQWIDFKDCFPVYCRFWEREEATCGESEGKWSGYYWYLVLLAIVACWALLLPGKAVTTEGSHVRDTGRG